VKVIRGKAQASRVLGQDPPEPKSRKTTTLVTEAGLRYYAAASTTVVARTPFGAFKLFKIMFGSDGSIYLPFPYLETKRGVLSEADPQAEPDPKTITLTRNGVVVDYDAKFAHHTSGEAHFSRTGKKDILPRRQSFRLDGPIGRVFDFRFYWLRGFEMVERRSGITDPPLMLDFAGRHPTSIRVWAEWRRKRDIIDNSETTDGIVGPTSNATERSTGTEVKFLFLGQPSSSALHDHLLLISAHEIPDAAGADKPTAIFMGGWDVHDGVAPATPKMLVFMYPFEGTVPS
jgi:hypothetical protein